MADGLSYAILAALALTGGVAGARALWFEPRSLAIKQVEVRSPVWPREAGTLRIALLADPHTAGPHAGLARLARAVAMANAARPDLTLLLGDYVITETLCTSAVTPEASAATLAALRAPLGVFAALGNHDWCYGGARVRQALEAAGIPVLDNEARRLEAGPRSFWLAGVGDCYMARADLAGTLRQVDDDGPVLVMTHSPDLFPEVPTRVALTVAGHTHGGQVRLPFLGCPVVPSRYGARYIHGHIVEDGRDLVVSAGIGHSLLPIRFGVPPEIVLVTLCSVSPPARRAGPPP